MAGNFNSDGVLDLATANAGSNDVSVLLGNGDGTFRPAVSYAAGTFPVSLAMGDFNGDGTLDLAVANSASPDGTVSILLGHGDGTFGPPASYVVGPDPNSLAVGDFNGDSAPDLTVAILNRDSVVLLGNGDGSFGSPVSYAAGNSYSVTVGDLNGDGLPDIVVVNGSNVSILLNDGIWPAGPGGVPRRKTAQGVPRRSGVSLFGPAASLILSAPQQSNVIRPSEVPRMERMTAPRVLDALFANATRKDPALGITGVPLVSRHSRNAARWPLLVNDSDLAEQLLTLPRHQGV